LNAKHYGAIGLFAVSAVCAAAYAGIAAGPVSYGTATTAVASGGNVAGISAILSFVGGIFTMLKSGLGNSGQLQSIIGTVIPKVVSDGTELLPLIAKGEGGIEMTTVRVAIFVLETHCALRQPDSLDAVHALAKAILVQGAAK